MKEDWTSHSTIRGKLGFAYVYGQDGTLLGEYGMGGSNSTGTIQYIYLPTANGPMPVAAIVNGVAYAVHSDHLNTPRKLTLPDGQVAWQWAYSAFGDEQPTLGAKRFTNETTSPTTGSTSIPEVTFNLRYPGQYYDKESNLHYNYFRSYSAERGRYTQADPIGLDGGFNRFGYVEGDALSYADPFGLSRLTLTLSGGQKIIVENPSATELINSINSVEDGKIITFQLSGYGDEFSQCISAGRGCRDTLTKNLGLLSNGVLVGNIKDALLRKMNSQGEVRLEGCNNASGDRNMVKSISEHMGSIPVVGGLWYQAGYENHWLFGNSSGSFGIKRVYVNGVLK